MKLDERKKKILGAIVDEYIQTAEPVSSGSLLEKEYLDCQISKLRNPIIANIFYRLKYIEMFGTGILRIKELYKDMITKPIFKIYENSITIELPTVDSKPNISKEEELIVDYLKKVVQASSSDISLATKLSKDKVLRLMKNLTNNGYVKTSGNGKGTKYSL